MQPNFSPTIPARLTHALTHLAHANDVRVCYACIVGSRSFGFAAPTSDYDVRFFFVRHPAWYLAVDLEERPDTLNVPPTDGIDLHGWDLRKALRLLAASNPALLEWLHSPLVLHDPFALSDDLRALLPMYLAPTTCRQHFWHLARITTRDYLKTEPVNEARYLHALHALLVVRWIGEQGVSGPLDLPTLVEELVDDAALRAATVDLLCRTRAGAAQEQAPHHPTLHPFIRQELKRLGRIDWEPLHLQPDREPLTALFRRVLAQAWETTFPLDGAER